MRRSWAVGALALVAFAILPSNAIAHPVTSAAPAAERPGLIPQEDEARYRSRVTAIDPRVPGLDARILGGQEKIELRWLGREPLVVLGTDGEPMLRFSALGVKANVRSPSVYEAAERFGRVDPPAGVDAEAPPRWRRIAGPGPFSWYEHRAQWMEPSRPDVVGDGAEPVRISDWVVPITVGGRPVAIREVLDWVPDPGALRAKRSEVSSPLLSLLVLLVAMGVGALVGVYLRGRLAPRPAMGS